LEFAFEGVTAHGAPHSGRLGDRMVWSERIYVYCERGQDPVFWAEPLNAVTNGAFIIAALLATWELFRQRKGSACLAEAGLVALVYVIGTGSFLFHTFATRWASFADWSPIAVFMLSYLAYVLRRNMGLPWVFVVPLVAAFYGALSWAGGIECRPALLPVTAEAGAHCLNGTAAYVPAFLTLVLLCVILAFRRHPSWRYFAAAAGVFLASMTFRTLDLELCDLARAFGRPIGTHFLWHILNAATLYLLLVAAIRHGRREAIG
jgi:hypothetical protein